MMRAPLLLPSVLASALLAYGGFVLVTRVLELARRGDWLTLACLATIAVIGAGLGYAATRS